MPELSKDVCGCKTDCPYFPNMDCFSWVFDEKEPYIKRRKEAKKFICGYDRHVIKSWTDEICPNLLEQKINHNKNNND